MIKRSTISKPIQCLALCGVGGGLSLVEPAKAVSEAIGYEGSIGFDATQPDSALREWMGSGKLDRIGWSAKVSRSEGIAVTAAEMRKRLRLSAGCI